MALTWIELGDGQFSQVEVIRTWNKIELGHRIDAIKQQRITPTEQERDSKIVSARADVYPALWDLDFLERVKTEIDAV